MSVVAVHAEAVSDAPAERVFEVLTDWRRHGEWMPFTRAEGGDKVGDEIRGWTGIGPVGFLDTMVITDWRTAAASRCGTPGASCAARRGSWSSPRAPAAGSSGPSASTCRSARWAVPDGSSRARS